MAEKRAVQVRQVSERERDNMKETDRVREEKRGGSGQAEVVVARWSLRIINAELRGLRDLSLEPRVSRVPLPPVSAVPEVHDSRVTRELSHVTRSAPSRVPRVPSPPCTPQSSGLASRQHDDDARSSAVSSQPRCPALALAAPCTSGLYAPWKHALAASGPNKLSLLYFSPDPGRPTISTPAPPRVRV